jgi:hypothetical protein
MTGAFVRIERGGRTQNVEFDDLSEKELEAFAAEHPDDADRWLAFLIGWIRERVQGLTPEDLRTLAGIEEQRRRLAETPGDPPDAETTTVLWGSVYGLVMWMQSMVREQTDEATGGGRHGNGGGSGEHGL